MECKCGGSCRDHTYKTKDGIVHEVRTCNGCGRRHEVQYRIVRGVLERLEAAHG